MTLTLTLSRTRTRTLTLALALALALTLALAVTRQRPIATGKKVPKYHNGHALVVPKSCNCPRRYWHANRTSGAKKRRPLAWAPINQVS